MIRILFFALIVRPLFAFFFGIRIRGKQNLPRQHPFILVSNHASHLDAIALLNLFPLRDLGRMRPVAAADYFNREGWMGRTCGILFNILPIERKQVSCSRNPLDDLRAALQRGESLIIFPEGTRSVTGAMGVFHKGVSHLMREFPGIPVVPVYLANLGRALPKGEVLLIPFLCEINIGSAICFHGTKEQIINEIHQAVLKLQEESTW